MDASALYWTTKEQAAIKKQDFNKCVAKVLSVKREITPAKRDRKMSSFQKTIEKIKNLEAEKKNILEIEGLKKMDDKKATALENGLLL